MYMFYTVQRYVHSPRFLLLENNTIPCCVFIVVTFPCSSPTICTFLTITEVITRPILEDVLVPL